MNKQKNNPLLKLKEQNMEVLLEEENNEVRRNE